ncbi:unnamed protein product [Caenorhabditis angaria]|uniref:Uncharacterized protein n=1 Tax=Caenorhabditis angaria TaxID=860376 RepID=A0A9P1J5M5_9PELO|nr:unnamed protein product [Caenorhabditis angaria]
MSSSENNTLIRRNSRTGSMRKIIHSSIRKTRKIFGVQSIPEDTETQVQSPSDQPSSSTVEEITESLEVLSFERNSCIRLSRISTKTNVSVRSNVTDKIFTSLKTKSAPQCILVKYFPKEGRTHDHNSTLNSFERKRRSHQVFGFGHHAKEQLFCPLQASQIELAFRLSTKKDVIIKVQAPSGETSSYINPKTHEYTSFTPSNIGCGHGLWSIHVAIRRGCRFQHEFTKSINLVGQGVLFFELDNHLQLREVERLWLDCLN